MLERDASHGTQVLPTDGDRATATPVRTRPLRVIVTPIAPPLIHPLSKRDVQLVISMLPPSSTEGLRSVSLLGERTHTNGWPIFASYRRLGFLRLHAVSSLPWRVPELPLPAAAELRLYGARVENRPEGARITWLGDSLHIFYVLGVLLPGVARHRREREGEGEPDSLIRSLADRDDPWWATDAAVHEWRELLRRDGVRQRTATS
jgi:hypothetical protein